MQWLQRFMNSASGKLVNVYFPLVLVFFFSCLGFFWLFDWFFVSLFVLGSFLCVLGWGFFVCLFFNMWNCWRLNLWISLGCFHAHVTSPFSSVKINS